jgi:hypothetical protein
MFPGGRQSKDLALDGELRLATYILQLFLFFFTMETPSF